MFLSFASLYFFIKHIHIDRTTPIIEDEIMTIPQIGMSKFDIGASGFIISSAL